MCRSAFVYDSAPEIVDGHLVVDFKVLLVRLNLGSSLREKLPLATSTPSLGAPPNHIISKKAGNYSQPIPEVAVAMKMAPGAYPRPGRLPEQNQSGLRKLSAMAADLCIVFGKILWGLGFFRRG